ncbi:MAG: outer membrane lipoprotein carrier protein LolA [Myxococcales bacterium]
MMRRAAVILGVLGVLASLTFGVVRAQNTQRAMLDDLLARFAKVQSLKAQFKEEKYMALLAVPLRSQGTLYYAKPRLLARHTHSPQKSSLVLRGDKLSFGDAKHQESMELASQPAVRVLVDTFVSVLSGDGAALAKLATLEVEELAEGAFQIKVTPKDPGVLKIVRSMSFTGKGAELSKMELLDANGDRTVTTFSELQLGQKLSDAEVARVFRIGG